ncbi:MAG: ATP-binding protein [Kiloniellales bacterium]
MIPWRQSIVARYVALSLIAAVLPLLAVGVLYDRYSSDLLSRLTGERLERRLTVMSSRLSAFTAVQLYQLETLAEYPFLSSLLVTVGTSNVDQSLKALVEFEANQPDLYGILLFSPAGTIVRAVPGQAASGPPYWGGGTLQLDGFARVWSDDTEIIGPIPGGNGRAGSLVLARELLGEGEAIGEGGRIALHLRLASLTELLGAEDEAGIYQPLLLVPSGEVYSNVATPIAAPARVIEGPEFLPGWRAALAVREGWLSTSLKLVRYALLAGFLIVVIVLTWLFLSLLDRIRGRVELLVDGAETVAGGDLSWRIDARGNDEIDTLARAFNAMAERLQTVIRSAVEVEKMAVLGRFATGVAHEVRNPLAALKTSVQVLLPGETDRDRQRILAGMAEEIDRLDGNMTDLLTFARPRDPSFDRVAVHEVLRHLLELVDQTAREIKVEIDCVVDEELSIRADPGHLQQVLMNLVLNGLEAMSQGGRLSLRGYRRNGNAMLEVADTGVGISDAALARITDAFFTTRPGGTGLGLAISRQLVEMNGGRLEFSSKLGAGTTATVVLPEYEER